MSIPSASGLINLIVLPCTSAKLWFALEYVKTASLLDVGGLIVYGVFSCVI